MLIISRTKYLLLPDERQALSLQPAQVLEGAKVRVRAVLVNTGLSAGYTMRQLGFYARAEDSGDEVLYALVQDEAGDPIPAAAESPGFSVDWTYVFSFGNAAEVTVELEMCIRDRYIQAHLCSAALRAVRYQGDCAGDGNQLGRRDIYGQRPWERDPD